MLQDANQFLYVLVYDAVSHSVGDIWMDEYGAMIPGMLISP